MKKETVFYGVIVILLLFGVSSCNKGEKKSTIDSNCEFFVSVWNESSMHRQNPSEDKLIILQPNNNVVVRVVKRGNPPKSGTNGATVSYELTNYSTSPDKTSDLETEEYISSGNLLQVKGLFMAEGIKGFHFYHSGACKSYQTVKITVKASDGKLIANANLAIPAFDEISCEKCHVSSSIGAFNDILSKHDLKHATTLSSPINQPVVCVSCHTGNLSAKNTTEAKENLSKAIHGSHANRKGITCNDCHVVISPNIVKTGKEDCILCHGEMATVASHKVSNHTTDGFQSPCETCHTGLNWTNPNEVFYGKPKGSGNPFCIACHLNSQSTSADLKEPIKY